MRNLKLKKYLLSSNKFVSIFVAAFFVVPAQAELIIADNVNSINVVDNGQFIHGLDEVPTDASITQFMQVMRINEYIDTIIENQNRAVELLEQHSATTKLDEDTDNRGQRIKNALQGLLQQYGQVLAGNIRQFSDKKTLTDAYIDAIKAHYNQTEIDAQIEFYDTPIGQSILEKNPQVTADFIKSTLPKEENIDKTQEQIEQILPQVKDLIKDIF